MVRRIEDPRQDDLGLVEVPRVFHAPAGWQSCAEFPELSGYVAVDLETKDPGIARRMGSSWPMIGEGFVCGVAIKWSGGKYYYPLAHAAGNLAAHPTLFWSWLGFQLAKPDVVAVMANAVYDTGWLKRMGIKLYNSPVDVQVMAFLLNEHRRNYSLASLAKDCLQRDKGTLTLYDMARSLHIVDPMSNMDKLPAWIVEPYALEDVDLTYALFYHLTPQIARQELEPTLHLECECTMVSVDMRAKGVRIDHQQLEQLGRDFETSRDIHLRRIKNLTGMNIQPFNMGEVAKALRHENSAVVLGITDGGRESVDRFTLERIGSPVALSVLQARKYEKARSTFVESLGKYIYNGRIHAEFHSTRNNTNNDSSEFGTDAGYGASSGRWASSHPNLQNIPNRDEEIGPLVRSMFVPEPGEQWCKLDYASQEPRLTVHIAYAAGQRGADAMVERFNREPMTDLHGECAQLMGVPRKQAKTINLALTYGQQGAALCQSLGLPTKFITLDNGRRLEVAGDEGERLLNKHFEAVPFIRGVFDLAKATAISRGYVKTLIGRRCRFERYPNGKYARVHKALNAVIQGNAADQMKQACVALRQANLLPHIIVHDEADRSIPPGHEGELVIERMVEIMEDIMPLSIPFIVEAAIGRTWGDVK